MTPLMLHRNLFLVPGRRRSTWQVSTAYRAKAGQSRGRKRRRRQDRRIFERVVAQVQAERVRRYDPSTVTIVINGQRHTLYPVSTSDYASAFPGIGATTTITLRLL